MEEDESSFFGMQRRVDANDKSTWLRALGRHQKIAKGIGALVALLVLCWPLRWIDPVVEPRACVARDVYVELEPASMQRRTTTTSAGCHRILIDLHPPQAENDTRVQLNASSCADTTVVEEFTPSYIVLAFLPDCGPHHVVQLAKASNATQAGILADWYRSRAHHLVYPSGHVYRADFWIDYGTGMGSAIYWGMIAMVIFCVGVFYLVGRAFPDSRDH